MEPYLIPLLGGIAGGLVLATIVSILYHRAKRKTASDLLVAAGAQAAQVKVEAARLQAEAAQHQAEAKRLADHAVADAQRDIEAARAAAVLEGKMESLKMREEVERDSLKRREEMERLDRRAQDREQSLDRRSGELKEQETRLAGRDGELKRKTQEIETRQAALEKLEGEERRRLERVAGMTAEDARKELMHKVEDEARSDAAALARDIKEQARKGAEKESKRIISMAIQRIAAEHTAESTVAAVTLPNDEMKGRIIGREGRNIRAFETATGVDVIIDDTPDTVVISCFDPVRREVARRALEALIADGRIHPGRIEEVVTKL
ncbi:MAG: Rnase Y domain-containing protein, partial [Gemmatimonadota bacterium]